MAEFFLTHRLQQRKQAQERLQKLLSTPEEVYLIHYTGESFFHPVGRTPRPAAVVCHHLGSQQTKSFALHLTAERIERRTGQKLREFNLTTLDQVEQEMLLDLGQFFKARRKGTFIHWQMRDIHFGFETLRHRWNLYFDKDFPIKEEQTVNLANLLEDIYTEEYAPDSIVVKKDIFQQGESSTKLDGKLLCLAYQNGIKLKMARSGNVEAKWFEDQKFLDLHHSAMRKVRLMEKILKLTLSRQLRVRYAWKQYGLSAQGFFVFCKNHWLGALLLAAVGWGIKYWMG